MIGLAQNAVKLRFFPVQHILVRACFSTSFCTGCFPPFCCCRCRCFCEAFLARGWIREKTKWIEKERQRERARAREREEEESWVGEEYLWSLCAERQTLLLLAFALPLLRLLPALRLSHALFATHPSSSQERRKRGRRGKDKGREEKQLRRASSEIPSPSVANYTTESFYCGMATE